MSLKRCDLTPLSLQGEPPLLKRRGGIFLRGAEPLLDTPYKNGELKRGFASLIKLISPSPC